MKLSPEITVKLCDLIKKGLFVETACRASGISPATFHQWMQFGREGRGKRYIEFFNAIHEAEATCEANLIGQWLTLASEKPSEMRAFLALRFPKRYGKDARPEARDLSDWKHQNRHEVEYIERLEPEPDEREVDDPNKFVMNERVRIKDGVMRYETDLGGWSGYVHGLPAEGDDGYLVEFDGDTQGSKINDQFAERCWAADDCEDFGIFAEDELTCFGQLPSPELKPITYQPT